MKPIRRLEELVEAVRGAQTMTVAVAAGEDPATIEAVAKGVEQGLIRVVSVGHPEKIMDLARTQGKAFADQIEIVPAENEESAAKIAVKLVREGRANVLMKGLLGTATFMKAILNKEEGLVEKGHLLSHVAVMQVPDYPRLLLVSDAAIIPNPTMDEKVKILEYAIEVANSLNIHPPKVSLISAAEKVNFRLQSSIDAAVIKAMAERHQITGAIVDGPLALDVSLSPEHCRIKGLESSINGEADILIFPNIETANTFYKSVTILAHGKGASIVVGTKAPVVLSSRADEDDTKFYSIVLAALMASYRAEKNNH